MDEPTAAQRRAIEQNRRAWDALVLHGQRFTRPAPDENFADPLSVVDGVQWLGGDIRGQRLLCLAAGGGKHGPLYAAAGADVTVVDLSPAMLALDRAVAAERGLSLNIVETSMDDLSMFATGQFAIVIHPVSTCYLPDVGPVYREIARVTAAGGLYISQHKTPQSLQAEIRPQGTHYALREPYYRSGPLPAVENTPLREPGTLEYLHRWEEILGLMCRAGFVIEDLLEPRHADPAADHGTFGHRGCFIAPYVRVKARRTAGRAASAPPPKLWTGTES